MKRLETSLAGIALIISVASAIFSWRQVEIAEKHNRISVYPLLYVTTHAEGPGGRNGIFLTNVGLGPAIITSFTAKAKGFTATGFKADMWPEVLQAAGVKPFCFATAWPLERSALKAGDELGLSFVTKAEGATDCYAELIKLMGDTEVEVAITYQSMYGETQSVMGTSKLNSAMATLIFEKMQQH